MSNDLNIDISGIGDGSGIVTGSEVIVLIGSAKVADSKAGNKMLKLTLNVVSAEGAGQTIWHQLMLVNPKNNAQTIQWLARAKRDLALILGYEPDAINADMLKELAGKAVRLSVKVEVTQEWGEQVRVDKLISAVTADELEASLGDLDFGNGPFDGIAVADDDSIAY
jgi:hypothetical protein